MELSLPTVKGNTAWGNKTVSRTGNTGMRRMAGFSLEEGNLVDGRFGDWLDIEHPRINFP
jgi:hypothetical protein